MSSILDKYLSRDKKKKRRPKDGVKVRKFKGGGLRIVDEDGFGLSDQKIDISDDDETAEELPQIAAVVDERPREAQLVEEMKQGKWKQLEIVGVRRHDSSGSDDDNQHTVVSKRRHDSDYSDNSPRHDSDGDISPPRQRRRNDSDGDISPPRQRRRHDSGDLSPPRRQHSQNNSNRRRHQDDDLSPPRNSSHGSSRDSNRGSTSNSNNSRSRPIALPEIIEGPKNSLPSTTLDGKKAGLQRASDLRNEMVDYRKREDEMFSNLDDEVSGRNAVTKLRDRNTGRERDLAAELAKKEEEDKVAAEKKLLYQKWGKGLKQVEEQATRVNEALHEVSKPLARYADDQDLDEYLKKQDRDGDPMLKFLSSKKRGGGHNSGKPAYQGPPPMPNRFAIPPGHRWDGVDRSGGYEKEWFSRINAKKALEEEAYKWSVEDL
ncbi:BUD13 homolog [Folsomia candida]|uniref:BUD13 homolog n=1 Tax=Folsomia candida TaxID=158441 RepID=A0A226E0K7_FOLCA|nr:BUD13 homolog [Folsomia candida]OXA50481.1 BUD13 [Folsomia candida]